MEEELFSKFYLTLVVSIFLFSGASTEARTFKDWHTGYISGKEAGDISACFAEMRFSNQAFMVRLFGEEMDFLLFRKDFTLPYGRILGKLIFKIDGVSFLLSGSTNSKRKGDISHSTQYLYIKGSRSDYGSIFNAIKFGKRFEIGFPNGDAYPVSLRGSSAALSDTGECWKKNPTGPWNNNPFKEKKKTNNPFDVT